MAVVVNVNCLFRGQMYTSRYAQMMQTGLKSWTDVHVNGRTIACRSEVELGCLRFGPTSNFVIDNGCLQG